MWPFLAVLGGVLANEMQAAEREKEARKQHIANMRLQYARSLDPDVPTYGYQTAQLNSQLASQRDQGQQQMIGSLLPIALQGLGQMSNSPDSTRTFSSNLNTGLSNAFDRANDASMFEEMQRRMPFRGL